MFDDIINLGTIFMDVGNPFFLDIYYNVYDRIWNSHLPFGYYFHVFIKTIDYYI